MELSSMTSLSVFYFLERMDEHDERAQLFWKSGI